MAQILGWLATIIFSLMYIPQIHKTIVRKSVKDVSLPMFIMGFIGNIIALWYAILICQHPLIIKYTIALIVIGIYIIFYFKIKSKEKPEAPKVNDYI